MKKCILILFLFMGIHLPSNARQNNSDWFYKTVRVARHIIEAGSGYVLLNRMHAHLDRTYWPNHLICQVWDKPQDIIPYGLGGWILLRRGLRGLNNELHIFKE